MEAAVPALAGAAILMLLRDILIVRKKVLKDGKFEATTEEVELGILKAFEKDVEWPVLAFFIFLFVAVGALEHSGALQTFADILKS